MKLVADCSVVTCVVLREDPKYAVAVMKHLNAGFFVPAHWHLETANTLLMSARTRRITKAQLAEGISLLKSLSVERDPETADHAYGKILQLAEVHRLTAYDAAYLELAIRKKTELVTLDKDLKKAARSESVLFEP